MQIPKACSGVDPAVLDPKNTWESKEEYNTTIKKLAQKFRTNFKRYAKATGEEVIKAGPQS